MGRLIFINKPEYVKRYLKLQEKNDKIKIWVIYILAILLTLSAAILTLKAMGIFD